MRRIVVLSLAVMSTLGCAAAVRWDKPGVSDAERQRDEAECVSRASREGTVPSAQAAGSSTSVPAEPTSTRLRTYDLAVLDECMKTRGYQQVTPTRPPA